MEALHTAAEWLDYNEGGGNETIHCKEVAAWLREQAYKAEQRKTCREAGIPVKLLREKLNSTHP